MDSPALDPHEAGLLAAILDEPTNELLRQVYADWLEERGDPRHEFLRIESQWTGLAPGEKGYAALKSRVTRLRKTLNAEWLALLDDARKRSQRELFRCGDCGRRLTSKEAIGIHPRTRLKLKTKRYCSTCWENAVRNGMRDELARDRFDPSQVACDEDE